MAIPLGSSMAEVMLANAGAIRQAKIDDATLAEERRVAQVQEKEREGQALSQNVGLALNYYTKAHEAETERIKANADRIKTLAQIGIDAGLDPQTVREAAQYHLAKAEGQAGLAATKGKTLAAQAKEAAIAGRPMPTAQGPSADFLNMVGQAGYAEGGAVVGEEAQKQHGKMAEIDRSNFYQDRRWAGSEYGKQDRATLQRGLQRELATEAQSQRSLIGGIRALTERLKLEEAGIDKEIAALPAVDQAVGSPALMALQQKRADIAQKRQMFNYVAAEAMQSSGEAGLSALGRGTAEIEGEETSPEVEASLARIKAAMNSGESD